MSTIKPIGVQCWFCGDQVVNAAYEYEMDAPAPQQIERAEEMLFQLAEQGSSETGFVDFKTAVTTAIDAAAAAGITAVIQPGGSMRDEEVIAAADEAGMAMVLTGMRHFRH